MTDSAGNETEAALRREIRATLALREDRAEITLQLRERAKMQRERGFDSTKITEVCRWLERCDRHGRDAMIEAEQIFELYREVAEGPDTPLVEQFEQARDKALVEIFASPPQTDDKPTKRVKAANTAAALAAAERKARGE